jgi:hypothetical protein
MEPPGQEPVPLAQQLHRRREQHSPDHRRVDQDREREPDSHLLDVDLAQPGEDSEYRNHHDRRGRHRPRRPADPALDRLLGREAAVVEFLDPADDEDVVVHREAEEDHEQEQREPGGDRAV